MLTSKCDQLASSSFGDEKLLNAKNRTVTTLIDNNLVLYAIIVFLFCMCSNRELLEAKLLFLLYCLGLSL